MPGANLESLQALIEFRESLPSLSRSAADEIQQMILFAQQAIRDVEQHLEQRRNSLWEAEDVRADAENALGDAKNALRDMEMRDPQDDTAVQNARMKVVEADNYLAEVQAKCEDVRIDVARAQNALSEAQAESTSFQETANKLTNCLLTQFTNAQTFLDERIGGAKLYRALSVSNSTEVLATNGTLPSRNSVVTASIKVPLGQEQAVASPLRGPLVSALPLLPKGMEWVSIDKIAWDGISGVPKNLEFKKASKEQIREMLETFETRLLPLMSENTEVTLDELCDIDGDNAYGGSSDSLRLSYECLVGSDSHSDVIVFQSEPSQTHEKHPAAGTRAFEEGRKARISGQGDATNPYRHQVGREGVANIWEQGWKFGNGQQKLGFTSGRHRALVARELGWKFIPARVIER